MNIGIASPITVGAFIPFLDDECKKKAATIIGMKAPAVDTIAIEFIRQGHHVVIFTLDLDVNDHVHLYGNNIDIYIGSYVNRSWWRIGVFKYRRDEIKSLFNLNKIKLDIIHAQWTREYALAAKTLKDKIPVVVTVRDWQPILLKNSKYSFSYILLWLMDYLVFKTKDLYIIANSRYISERIKQRWGFSTKYFNNPVSNSFFNTPLNTEKNDSIFTIITISNGINSNKNIDNLLRGYKEARKYIGKSQLLLVGNDFIESNSNVINWKTKLLLDDCILCGAADRNQLICLLDSSDVMFHPSLEESFGNVLIEGLARGLHVIGGINSGAVPYVLENGRLGSLCNIKDIHKIAEQIIDAYNNKKNYRLKAIEISEYVKTFYSANQIALNMTDFYKNCIINHENKQ